MITRIVATAIVVILAFGAFWLNPGDAASIAAGIILLLFAGVIWFKWQLVRDAVPAGRSPLGVPAQRKVIRDARNTYSGPPINRFGSNAIMGLFIAQQPSSGRSASSDQ